MAHPYACADRARSETYAPLPLQLLLTRCDTLQNASDAAEAAPPALFRPNTADVQTLILDNARSCGHVEAHSRGYTEKLLHQEDGLAPQSETERRKFLPREAPVTAIPPTTTPHRESAETECSNR